MSEAAVITRRNVGESSAAPAGSVLIIDDEAEIRRITLQTLLEMEGYEVDSAPTGEEGLARIGERTFDLVLLDLALPDRNGIDLLAELHNQAPQIAVIMITPRTGPSRTRCGRCRPEPPTSSKNLGITRNCWPTYAPPSPVTAPKKRTSS